MGFQGFTIENNNRKITILTPAMGFSGFSLRKTDTQITFIKINKGFSGFNLEDMHIPRAIVRFRRK